MTISVELDQLLNLALGSPEQGAVNFNILHGVLLEILVHLGIEKKSKDIPEDGDFRAAFAVLKNKQDITQDTDYDDLSRSKTFVEVGMTDKIPFSAHSASFSSPFGGNLEVKVASIEKKLEILDDLPSNGEILQRAKLKKDGRTPVADMWQFININRRLGAAETGIEKVWTVKCVISRRNADDRNRVIEKLLLNYKLSIVIIVVGGFSFHSTFTLS